MQADLTTYSEVRAYLYGLKHRGANYGIDRMLRFAERLGQPQNQYPCIHIAGTNGKGSTCAMLEAIYRASGRRVGMFTSPHLVYQGERVQVNREILSRDQIVAYTRRLRPVAEQIEREEPGLHPTFFEFMTGMAFLRFAEAEVDLAVIETGLGGRLDATNVVMPEVAVITSISFDHTEILGESIEAIATEKAGIIKAGKPVVIGLLPEAAEAVITRIAAERESPLFRVRDAFGCDLQYLPETILPGDYQRFNAATAKLTVNVLQKRFPVLPEAIVQGLNGVKWPGRWEPHSLPHGTLVLDASHNPEGIHHLELNLRRLIERTGRPPIILAGTLGDKRAQALMPVLARYAREIHLLVPQQARACSFEALRAALPDDFDCPVYNGTVADIFPAQGVCRLAQHPEDVIVATGSIYLIGEIMEALYHHQPVTDAILQD